MASLSGGLVTVVDLAAADAATRLLAGDARPVKVIYTWRHTVIGEQLLGAAARGAPQAIPADVVRRAAEEEASERLRPVLAPLPDPPQPPVSVVACTLHRPAELDACLASLEQLRDPPLEILVVNNDPADFQTRAVAEARGAHVIDQPRRGLSAARNAGIAAARGELVAFVDDDCVVDEHWLAGLGVEFAHPLVAACVGYVGPAELSTEAQLLFEAQGGFERRFVSTVIDGAQDGAWAASGLGDGNSVWRRAVFERYGGFAEDLGPGTSARSAQDADMFHRLLGRGYRVRVSPARVVWHRQRRELAPLADALEGYMTGLAAVSARALAGSHDLAAARLWSWWVHEYAPRLLRHRTPGSARLLVAQARGILAGPWRDRRALCSPTPPPALAARPASQTNFPASVTLELAPASIVLASRDRRELLLRVLRALAAQDCPADQMEVVIVLDGSTDGSAEAVRRLDVPWPLWIEAQPPRGLAVSRNRGIELASEPLLLLLDDDIIPARRLVSAHRRAHADGAKSVVMGRHPAVVPETSWWAQRVRAWWEDRFARMRQPGWRPSFVDYADGNSSMLRSTFDQVGGFDVAFTGGQRQDWEFAIRALQQGISLRIDPAAEAVHHADASFGGTLRKARQEGAYDVAIARKHPPCSGRLLLSRVPGGRPVRRIAVDRGESIADEHLVALANACERIGARRSWSRIVSVAIEAAYLAGVRHAASPAELDALRASLAKEEDVVTVALDPLDPDRLRSALSAGHQGRVMFELGSERVEATVPGETWDAERLLGGAAALFAAGEQPDPR